MLTSTSRILPLVEYWTSHVFPSLYPTIPQLIEGVLETFLTEPVHLIIGMKHLTFLKFPIPLRYLEATEVNVLYSLLQQHHNDANRPLFQSHLGLQGFKLRYDHFRYNTYLSQRLNREAFVVAFLRVLLALASDDVTHNKILDLVVQYTHQYTLKEHPTQVSILENVAALRL